MIESSVFSDDHDDVLDRAASGFFLLGLKIAGERAAQAELKYGHRDESDAKCVLRL